VVAALPADSQKKGGLEWGEHVADIILQWRATDGSDSNVVYAAGTGPGIWQPTPPALAPALLPQWSYVVPFAMNAPTQFRPPPPPILTSAEYTFDFNFTKTLGAATGSSRTAEQTQIALFWSDGAGTVTPPGHWNQIAQSVAIARDNSIEQNARLFALLNIALADAAVVSWDCKYTFNYWRPITAIRVADTDGNPDTVADPIWSPLIVTPPFPEYTSGHSTFSGAAAAVLAAFYDSDDIQFTTVSDGLPTVTRSFVSFSGAAVEAGMSRIYGGIHFMSANRNGLLSGASLGAYVSANSLLPKENRSRLR
jgi:membrane-associated phospholipid phosphatase